MSAIKRIEPGDYLSHAVVYNGVAYLAGVVADDPSQDVKGQTRQCLAEIDRLLAMCGSNKSKILSANIWLTDIGTWSEMNAIWSAWVPKGSAPARATVEAKLAGPEYRVEIMVQAAV